tara:strand:+ start:506 stop:871 length:366 start_codon:yes stop_codon:yes gene_type:complete
MKKIIVVCFLLLIFLISIFLSGCSDEAITSSNQQNENENCESNGGQLIGCMTKTGYACSMPTNDGGKPCSDSNECEQECVAPENCEAGKTNIVGKCADRTFLICDGVSTVKNGVCGGFIIS